MVGDAADRKFLRTAVAGVDTIYHIGPTAHPLERDMGFATVDAARDVEEHLLEANIPFTVLQPADYMVPVVFQPVFSSGVWEQLYDLRRRQATVALEDVAEVAVKVARA
jgi:uncharacterized protein YbjT (DUF2867 family)